MSDTLAALSPQQTSGLIQSVVYVAVSIGLAGWMIARTSWWVSRLSQERLGRWLSDRGIALTVRITALLLVVLALLVAVVNILSIRGG